MENKFCYLKGLVDCDSGRIQDCNNQRTKVCPLEQEKKNQKENKNHKNKDLSNKNQEGKNQKEGKEQKKEKQQKKQKEPIQSFCYLKGLVSCTPGRVQDCNTKRVKECPLDE